MTEELTVYLNEYTTLKEEQKTRIGFRDNLLYANLAAVGAVISFTLSKPDNKYGLLVLPLVCLVLGWTYLVNDQKISAIGQYIRSELSTKVSHQLSATSIPVADIFGWELFHTKNNPITHGLRKFQQLLIDEITFVGSGILGLIIFHKYLAAETSIVTKIWWIELIFLILLGLQILIYAVIAWIK